MGGEGVRVYKGYKKELEWVHKSFNEMMFRVLGPMNQEWEVFLEARQPSSRCRWDSFKVAVVPFFPETPCCCSENLHEHRLVPRFFAKGRRDNRVKVASLGKSSCTRLQQFLAKSQWKNRCSTVLQSPSCRLCNCKLYQHYNVVFSACSLCSVDRTIEASRKT